MARTIGIWISGLLAAAFAGGIIGNYLDRSAYHDGGSIIAVVLAGLLGSSAAT